MIASSSPIRSSRLATYVWYPGPTGTVRAVTTSWPVSVASNRTGRAAGWRAISMAPSTVRAPGMWPRSASPVAPGSQSSIAPSSVAAFGTRRVAPRRAAWPMARIMIDKRNLPGRVATDDTRSALGRVAGPDGPIVLSSRRQQRGADRSPTSPTVRGSRRTRSFGSRPCPDRHARLRRPSSGRRPSRGSMPSGPCRLRASRGRLPHEQRRRGSRTRGQATRAATTSSKTSVWRSTSASTVAGLIRAMLWNGVISTPRFMTAR